MYKNFTGLFRELFKEDKAIAEIGVGGNQYPLISILQACNIEKYYAIDGAKHYNESSEFFNQVGGIRLYEERVKDVLNYLPPQLHTIRAPAHFLNLPSCDSVMFFKTLYKLTDGMITGWRRNKKYLSSLLQRYEEIGIHGLEEKEYKFLTILLYNPIVLEEARRIGGKIVIVPEEKLIEGELRKDMERYATITHQEIEMIEVERPTLTVEINGNASEVPHWQDNSSKLVICIKTRKGRLRLDGIVEYLKTKGSEISEKALRILEKHKLV